MGLQAQLVYESGQLKGSIAVTSPHRMGRSYPTSSIKDTLSSKTCLLSDSSSQLEERSRKLVNSDYPPLIPPLPHLLFLSTTSGHSIDVSAPNITSIRIVNQDQ